MKSASNVLHPEWDAPLNSPRPIEISYSVLRSRDPVAWGTEVVDLLVDARPLALLAQSALLGHRVYELFAIQRPGDVLRYLWVRWADEPSLDGQTSSWFRGKENQQGQPFLKLDRKHWMPESGWLDDDASNSTRAWLAHRRTQFWSKLCTELLAVIREVQDCIRSSTDELIRMELALMDAGQHRRDLWPTREQVGRLDAAPAADTTLPRELFESILQLAGQDDVRSVSCPLSDPALWRGLAMEQLRRARALNQPPQEALFLAGPEGGIPHAMAEDWGAAAHIPYEGCCEADVFIQPSWFNIDVEETRRAGSIRAGMGHRECRYVIANRDYGQPAQDVVRRVGSWFLYGPKQV